MAEDPLTTHARARVGRLLRGKWTLDRLIGVGGMAAVYEATHRNGSKVAIKLLHPTLMFDTGFAQRLVQEGYVANKIAHPAAVKVFDDDTDDVDGAVFLVMELLEGQPLSSLRRQRKRIPPDEALRLMAPVMECLGFAHQKGIVHRDIKPDNLFVSRDGAVRVLDFGIARINDGSNVNATRTGMVVGSPAYMAPEQALGKMNAVGSQTDVYAIGATLFALITGTTPHAGESTQEMIIMVATQAARPLASVMPDVHPAVARVVDKALAYERDQRYPDAMAMLHDVRAALLEMETGAPPQVLPSFADDEEEGETRVSPAMKKDGAEAKPAPAAGQGRVGARPAPPASPFGPPIRPNEAGASSQPGATPPQQPQKLRAATMAPTGAPSSNLTPKGMAPAQPALPATQAMEAFPVPSDNAPVSEPPPPPQPAAAPMATQAMDISSFNNPMAPLAPMAPPEVGVTSGQRPEVTTGMAWAGASDEVQPKPSRAKPLALAAAGLVVLLGVGFALKSALGTDDPAPVQTATPPATTTPARPATPPVAAQPETPPAQPETPPAQPETPPVVAQPETPPAQPETPPVVAQPETPPAQPEVPPAARPEPSRGAHERRRATPASDTPTGNTARPRRRRNADPLGY